MKKAAVLILLGLAATLCSNAQLIRDLGSLYQPSGYKMVSSDSLLFTPNGIVRADKTDFSLSMGTGYTSFGRGAGFSSSYVAPTFSYAPTEKLQLVVGAAIGYNSYNSMLVNSGYPSANQLNATSSNPSEFFAYGKYAVNQRFSVYGYGSFAKNQLYLSPLQPGLGHTDYGNVAVGFDYKIGKNSSIGASFGFSNGPAFGLSPFGSAFPHTILP